MKRAIVSLLIATASCTPFTRTHILETPKGVQRVEEITPEGHLRLDDGRTIRLFGVQIPDAADDRAAFVRELQARTEAPQGVEIVEVLQDEPPAADVVAWTWPYGGFGCGTSLNPLGEVMRVTAQPVHLSSLVLRMSGSGLHRADLDDPSAPDDVVKRLRREFSRDETEN